MRWWLLSLALLHAGAPALAQAPDPLDAPGPLSVDEGPAGDPPPPPGPLEDPEQGPPPPLVEHSRPSDAPSPRKRARRPQEQPLDVAGRAALTGALGGVAGAGGALVVGGATLASLVALSPFLAEPQTRVSAALPLLLGAAMTPFAGGLAAGLALLLIDEPAARPEEYADLVQTCGTCALGATCGVLCLMGAVVGSPAVFLSPSCGMPFGSLGPQGPLFSDMEPRREVYLAAVGAGGGAAAGGAIALFTVLSQPVDLDQTLTGAAVLGGAVVGAALGGGALGAMGAVVDRRSPYAVQNVE